MTGAEGRHLVKEVTVVEARLGLGSVAGEGLLGEAVQRWPQWVKDFPELGSVGAPEQLRSWLATAEPDDTRRVLLALVSLGAVDGWDDAAAAAMVAWALIPGARCLARRLGPAMRAQVPGQLWIAVRTAPWRTNRWIAAAILKATKVAILADEVGESHVRVLRGADLAETATGLITAGADVTALGESCAAEELLMLLEAAEDEAVLSKSDRLMLMSVLRVAGTSQHGFRKGHRQGLLAADLSERVGDQLGVSGQTVRRRVGASIDALSEVASHAELALGR